MIQTLLGRKIDQTQKFLSDGTRVPVTEISMPDNTIVQVKTVENDSYTALQIGIGVRKNPVKALVGHAKKAGFDSVPYVLREIRISTEEILPKAGEYLKAEEVFKPGDIIDVLGTSKGKGFAGGVKRYNFRGGPKTHGQSDRHRAPGSIGQTTTPGRVYKGKRMAGHMGADFVTIKNLKVVEVDPVNKKIYVIGLVPGVRNSVVCVTRTGESKKTISLFVPPVAKANTTETPVQNAVQEAKTESKVAEVKASVVKETVKEIQKGEVKESGK